MYMFEGLFGKPPEPQRSLDKKEQPKHGSNKGKQSK